MLRVKRDYHYLRHRSLMIKNIFISNVLESYYENYLNISEKERNYWFDHDYREANRAFLYGADDKVIITSYQVNPANAEYIKTLCDQKNVINLFPQSPTPNLCEDCMQGELSVKLIKIIEENPGVDVISYRITPQFYYLLKFLREKGLNFNTPEALTEDEKFILDYAGTKRGFRHLWERAMSNKGLKIPINIPYGFITGDKKEAIEAARWFNYQGKSFVMKINTGASGVGVLMLQNEEVPGDKDGFYKFMKDKLVEDIWNEPMIIVEEMIDTDHMKFSGSPNIEMKIRPDGVIERLYACEQVLGEDKKTFLGIYINPEVNNSEFIKNTYEAAVLFGKELNYLGYKGIYDVDLVISKNNEIYAVESNLRRTGGTHTHEFAQQLLGADYWQKYYILSEDVHLKNKITFTDLKIKLEKYSYNAEKKEGYFLYNADMLEVRVMSIIYVANTSENLQNLRSKVNKII